MSALHTSCSRNGRKRCPEDHHPRYELVWSEKVSVESAEGFPLRLISKSESGKLSCGIYLLKLPECWGKKKDWFVVFSSGKRRWENFLLSTLLKRQARVSGQEYYILAVFFVTVSVNTVEFQAQTWEINRNLFDVGVSLVSFWQKQSGKAQNIS